MPGAAGQLKALWQQIIGGTAPSGAASSTGDVSQMVKYIVANGAALPQIGFRLVTPIDVSPTSLASVGTTTWPAANDAIFLPFTVDQAQTIAKIHILVASAGGNLDAGIYNTAGVRQVSNGSVAAAAGIQTFDVADTALAKGRYYVGLACNNSGAVNIQGFTQAAVGTAGSLANIQGVKKQATAFALPANATFASPTTDYLPLIVLEWV